jgi:RND family efflux transporter MFP subunit
MRVKSRPVLFIAAAVLAVIAVAVILILRRPAELAVREIRPETVEQALSVVGRARPTQLVQVSSPNSGQVIRLFHDDGDSVAAGAPLAVILATVEQAQTEVDMARAGAARAAATEARLSYERTRTLYQRGFAAKAALDAARAALDTAEANVAAASASVRASEERAREFTIRAPMAGVVLVRPIDNGQVVAAGETLFELGSATGVEIRAEV